MTIEVFKRPFSAMSNSKKIEKEKQEKALRRPVHTFSIVARDPKTGEIGVAVQSHWFSVGPVVP